MLRSIETFLIGGTLFFAFPGAALASLAATGYTGMISTPTPQVMQHQLLAVSFSWVDGMQTYLHTPMTNRLFVVTTGLLPGLEATLRFTQVVGMIDPEAPGVAYNTDRLFSAKYQIPLPHGWPLMAIGMQDIASANQLAGFQMVPGSSQYGQSTVYGVIGGTAGKWGWHLGLGRSQAFINGAFVGTSYRIPGNIDLMAEYDSRHMNWGIRVSPTDALWIQAAKLGSATWALNTGFVFQL